MPTSVSDRRRTAPVVLHSEDHGIHIRIQEKYKRERERVRRKHRREKERREKREERPRARDSHTGLW